MKTKRNLLLVLLLTIFLTLPITCNAEEIPNIKWQDFTVNESAENNYRRDSIYNINNDILNVHTSSPDKGNYIRLYDSSGKKKWEYDLGNEYGGTFLINNEYLGMINYSESDQTKKHILIIDLKNGKINKKINISKVTEVLENKSSISYVGYHNNEIKLLFFSFSTNSYEFFSIDLDGNIKVSKIKPLNQVETGHEIVINNNIYIIKTDKIITISMDTGEITNITPVNIEMGIYGVIKYKDGFLIYGTKSTFMAVAYYNLKTGDIQIKQFEEEGLILSASLDEKENLYIAGYIINYDTGGTAYLSKYSVKNWNFQKEYDAIYDNEKVKNIATTYNKILALKNNKFVVVGNTLSITQYFTDNHFIVYYDNSKNYKIDKVIKGNGNIDIVESEEENNEVKYQVKPGFGYKLISLKIVTESGKEIEVSDDYKFIMPNENITITAVFEPIISNPVTSNNLLKILLVLTISIPTVYLINKNIKKKKYNN